MEFSLFALGYISFTHDSLRRKTDQRQLCIWISSGEVPPSVMLNLKREVWMSITFGPGV